MLRVLAHPGAAASRELSRSVAQDGMSRERAGRQVCARRFRRLVDQVLANLGVSMVRTAGGISWRRSPREAGGSMMTRRSYWSWRISELLRDHAFAEPPEDRTGPVDDALRYEGVSRANCNRTCNGMT